MDLELLTQLLIIIGIDIVLGGDNAIMIAMAARNLPESQRNKAIILGTGLAIIIRICLTVLAVYLLQIPYLQFIGGLLLVWVAYQLVTEDPNENSNIKGGKTLFQAIKTIILADILMGFDNVLAIAGAANHQLNLVFFGLLVSIPIIIWGSKLILVLMERYPIIIYLGAAVLAYTAGSMITNEERLSFIFKDNLQLSLLVPLCTIIFVLTCGFLKNKIKSITINYQK